MRPAERGSYGTVGLGLMEIHMPKRVAKPQLGVKVVYVALLSFTGILFVLIISKDGNVVSKEPAEKVRDDLSPKGVCGADIRRFCKGVPPGEAAWLHCLSDHIWNSYPREHGLSTKCKEDMRAFKKTMYRDIARDKKMLAACREDLKHCGLGRKVFHIRGQGNSKLDCLREMRFRWEPLSDACAAEVFRAQLDFADDLTLDVNLDDSCRQDVPILCKDVKATRGQVQKCLRANATKVEWGCQGALRQQEFEHFTDIRLHFTLFEACLSDVKAFCPHVDLGKELVTECLEEHRLDPQFSSRCKEEFDKFLQRRAEDERLHAGITRECKDLPRNQTRLHREWPKPFNVDSVRVNPLYSYGPYTKCQQQYRQIIIRASEDYRFDSLLFRSCAEERGSLCKSVADGGGRVLACFKEKRDYLTRDCKNALEEREFELLLDIDFDFLLNRACSQELGALCKNVSKFEGAPLACLLENMEDSGMGSKCKVELKDRQRLMASDYRYNWPLSRSCDTDLWSICPPRQPSPWNIGPYAASLEVKMLACLAANITKITSLACKLELWAFQKQVVRDITLDVPLQQACRGDMGQLCPAASTDHSQTLACLRSNRDKLSQSCKTEEQRLSKMEPHLAAEDASTCLGICGAQREPKENSETSQGARILILDDLPHSGACAADIKKFCHGVTPGPGAWLDCLSDHLKASHIIIGDTVTKKCKHEVRAFKMKMYRDIRMDRKMMTACFQELMQYCTDSPSCVRWTSPPWESTSIALEDCDGTVATLDHLACLRDTSFDKNMSNACAAEVFRAKLDAAHDFALDASLDYSCSSDAARLCNDVPSSGGQVQKCLRAREAELTDVCQLQLKRQELDNAIDLRLNVPLYEGCLKDTKAFCSHVAPGDVLLADCLDEHRLDPQFSRQCKEEMDNFLQRRAEDLPLDVALQWECKSDMEQMCDLSLNPFDPPLNEHDLALAKFACLQDHHDKLGKTKCSNRVLGYAKRGNEDIRFYPHLNEECHQDRAAFCKDVPDGRGAVFRCLQLNRSKLQVKCAWRVREVETMMSKYISIDYLLNEACTEEAEAICKHVPDGKGGKLSCLLEVLEEAPIGAKCKKELKYRQAMMARDYGYNYPLSSACYTDFKFCEATCEGQYNVDESSQQVVSRPCQGSLFTCLYHVENRVVRLDRVNRLPIRSPACKLEIMAFQKQVLRDPSLDILLQTACNGDIERLCSPATNNYNETMACLRKHKDQLTPRCGVQVERFNQTEKEATNLNLLSPLERRCGPEVRRACSDAQTEDQAARCLLEHAEDGGELSPSCKTGVDRQLALENELQALVDRVMKACLNDLPKGCNMRSGDTQTIACLVGIAARDISGWKECNLLPANRWTYNYQTRPPGSENDIKLSPACFFEVAQALNQTLEAYRLDSPFTMTCDRPILNVCPTPEIDPEAGVLPGAFDKFLDTPNRSRTEFCFVAVGVAQSSLCLQSRTGTTFHSTPLAHASARTPEVVESTSLMAEAESRS